MFFRSFVHNFYSRSYGIEGQKNFPTRSTADESASLSSSTLGATASGSSRFVPLSESREAGARLSIDDLHTLRDRASTTPIPSHQSSAAIPGHSNTNKQRSQSASKLSRPRQSQSANNTDAHFSFNSNKFKAAPSSSSLLKFQNEQLQNRHGLSADIPLVREKKSANLGIIRTPLNRQKHGNRNTYDHELFTWVPTVVNKPDRDTRFQTVRDLQVAKKKFQIYHTSQPPQSKTL